MKKLLTLTAISALLCACHSIELPVGPNGAVVKIKSYGQKVTLGGASYSTNGTLTLTNYNLDQVSGIQATSQLINSGIATGMQAAGKSVVP